MTPDVGYAQNRSAEVSQVERLARQLSNLSPREHEELGKIIAGREVKNTLGDRMQMAEEAIPGELRSDIGLAGYSSQELGLNNIEDAMRYQPWHKGQVENGEQVRDALTFAAKAILRNVPRSPLRTRALNCIIDARMLANAGITFGGRF